MLNSPDMYGLKEFWRKLLPLTIRHAIESNEFYRHLFCDLNPEHITSPEDLLLLPIVTRSTLRAAGKQAVSSGLTCIAIQNTSGTTGKMLFLHRSMEEFSFIRSFFGEILSRVDSLRLRQLVLVVDTAGHGVHTPIPSLAFTLQSNIGSLDDLESTVAYLSREYEIEGVEARVSALVGAVSQINLLTNFLITNDLCHLMDPVETLSLTSDYLSPANRSWLEECWGQAVVIDRYSMAECFGGATYCTKCQGFHFDPLVVPELLALNGASGSNVLQGQLAVTALFPFVQMQPLIRYQTDDLFELASSKCASPCYNYLGRVGHSLVDPLNDNTILIPGAYLHATLDEMPGIVRKGSLGDAKGAFYGKPIVQGRCSTDGDKRILDLTVVIDGHSDAETITESFVSRLRERCVELDHMINTKQVEFSVNAVRMAVVDFKCFSRDSRIWTLT